MKKIKNCPFCGVVPRVTAWHHGAYVSCWNPACPCTPTTLVCHTKEEAINFWNRRPGDEENKGDTAMVLIDIPMPQNCEECPVINADEDCPFYPEYDQRDTFTEQYARCPLKEVQE